MSSFFRKPPRARSLCVEQLEVRRMMAVDVVLEWNAVMLEANANDHALAWPDQGGPVLTARAFAMVSGAMYDAYTSIEHVGPAFHIMVPGATNANSHAAVAQAAHDTLVSLFPQQADLFQSALEVTLDRVADGPAEDWGRMVGAHVAAHMHAAREMDGTDFIGMSYDPSGEMGFHDVDPLNPQQGFYAPGAMDIAPFAMTDVNHFMARKLDDGTTEGRAAFLQSAEYTAAYQEVMQLGGDGITTPTERTEEQTIIGNFWAYDGRPGLGTPPRMFNQIVREVAAVQQNSEAENAKLFALVNLALGDAGVASWNTKYDDALWRPVLGIRHGEDDGNPDTTGQTDWSPLGAPASNARPGEINFTPPFPAYTSGHATFGAAAMQMLTNFYGRDDISFTIVSDEYNGQTVDAEGQPRPWLERSFDSFSQAKIENAESRIYLGIHWRFDADEGIAQGDAIADYVFDAVMVGPYTFDPADYPRHHQQNPTDVDTNNVTTLNDALMVVSYLRQHDGLPVELPPPMAGGGTHPYYDVNADNLVTLSDALNVVAILRMQLEGEAEAVEAVLTVTPGSSDPSGAMLSRGETSPRSEGSETALQDEALRALLHEMASDQPASTLPLTTLAGESDEAEIDTLVACLATETSANNHLPMQ